jgi:hypothetical protein
MTLTATAGGEIYSIDEWVERFTLRESVDEEIILTFHGDHSIIELVMDGDEAVSLLQALVEMKGTEVFSG